MAEPSGAQKFFEAAVSIIQTEADGFAGVLDARCLLMLLVNAERLWIYSQRQAQHF